MRYVFLGYLNEAAYASLPAAEQQADGQKAFAFIQEAEQRGVREVNARLQPSSTATTVRARDGQLLTGDGPYVETTEQLGAVYILNCKNLDEAIEFAGKIPAAWRGVVEIRPLVEV